MREHPWPIAIAAVVLAISMGSQVGGHEPVSRLVRVNGTRVHLRSGIPVRLDHGNVTHHLQRSELFSVDRVSLGISATGVGADGTWLHVTSVRDPNMAGWVCARYVAEVATPATPPEPEREAPVTGNDPTPPPSTLGISAVSESSAEQALTTANNILAIMNSLLSMLALFAPALGLHWLLSRFAAPRPAYVPQRVMHPPARKGAPPSRNNFYGKGWWIAVKR